MHHQYSRFYANPVIVGTATDYDWRSPVVLGVIIDYFVVRIPYPVLLTSAGRSPSHNARVGGASGSFHIKVLGGDLKVQGLSGYSLYHLAKTRGAFHPLVRGIGVYRAHIHIDARTSPTRVEWIDNNRR